MTRRRLGDGLGDGLYLVLMFVVAIALIAIAVGFARALADGGALDDDWLWFLLVTSVPQ